MKKTYAGPDFWFCIRVITLVLMVVFLIYPFSSLIIKSFYGGKEKGLTLENYQSFFKLPYYYRTLLNSLNVSLTATFTALIIGLPMCTGMVCLAPMSFAQELASSVPSRCT